MVTTITSSTVTSGRESSSPRMLRIQGSRTLTVGMWPLTSW